MTAMPLMEAREEIPLTRLDNAEPELMGELLATVAQVAREGAFTLGRHVQAFERDFAAYCETPFAVGVSSGTEALALALRALRIGPGDEVMVPANSFIATAEAVSAVGARPLLVDVDPDSQLLTADIVAAALRPAVRCVIPVHLYGATVDLQPILEVTRRAGVEVLEDACQAHGARYRGRRAGSLSQAAAFSFYPSKNLGAYGEGGALTTNDDRIAEYARVARNHGQSNRYEHEFVGYNYRMDGFQGAVLQIKLRRLDEWNARRRELAATYRRLLADVRVDIPQDDSRDEVAYHLFVIYLNERDCVRRLLADRGVETMIHYPRPLHLQPAYATLGIPEGSLPHAELACERVLSLPLFPSLPIEQAEFVATALSEIVGRK